MGLIKVLPESLVNQIAAGEVIERPASVVKELVDNALDAGATRVVVEAKDGGRSFLKVVDNGCGMSRGDLEMSVVRHATSKISDEADLWRIGTMGFRGEALASIASVSKMVLKSKRTDSDGYELECFGGDMVRGGACGMSEGTVVEVRELFFNTPARQKYLKQDSTEFGHISAALSTLALANFGVAFKLVHNGKEVFDLPAVSDLKARVRDVFGAATSENMVDVFYGGSDFKLDGFVGKPLISRSNSKHQYLFVNGRPVTDHLIAHAVKRAFHSMLMEHKKPVFILNLQIDPALIDVNVHPRKVEIRFEDHKGVMSKIYGAVKTAFEGVNLVPKGFSESQRYMSTAEKLMKSASEPLTGASRAEGEASEGLTGGGLTGEGLTGSNPGGAITLPGKSGGGDSAINKPISRTNFSVQEAMNFSAEMMRESGGLGAESGGVDEDAEFGTAEVGMTAIVQIANSYIVAKNGEGLVLIDQHAAHERVRYEELMAAYHAQEVKKQPLLVPLQLELSGDELAVIEGNMEVFEGLGFEIEPFGGNSWVVQAVPGCLAGEDCEVVVKGVIDDLLAGEKPSAMQGKVEEILTYMSCRSAIKFGQSLSGDEMQSLIKQLDKCEKPFTCPHGRPTMVALSVDELAKMFGRK